jgi:hypothetical protein
MAGGPSSTIERVVKELNARAMLPTGGVGTPWEDGGEPTFADFLPAAWTVPGAGLGHGDGPAPINVAVLGASTAAQVQDVVNTLSGDPRIASVTGIVTTTVTPTLTELQAFDSVLVYTNSTPQSSVALGDALADYIDGGGGVVLTMFAIRASLATRTMEGRFLTDNYYCIERSVGASTTGRAFLGTIHVPDSPLVQGVSTFDGGSSSFRTPAPLNPNAVQIADWSTGQILIAQRTDLNGGRVDLGFFAVSQLNSSGSWVITTDGAPMLRNAVVVAAGSGGPACPGTGSGACSRADWNEDGVIDFNDFLAFLNDYNAENPCADLNGDGVIDFNDFLEFLNLYNTGC